MRISQDSFNKLVTGVLLIYVIVMYTLAWVLARPLDLASFWVMLAPLVAHTVQLLSNKVTDKAGSNGGKP